MGLTSFAVHHPVVVAMLLIVLLAFGVYALTGLNVEFIGDISLPTVEVLTIYPGAGAEDVEREITDPMEQAFVTLPDFDGIDSRSTDSLSWITITFRDGTDPYDMLPEVRNRIREMIPSLPESIEGEPMAVIGGSTMLPVMVFSVEGGGDIARLTRYLEDTLVPRITRIEGVSDVEISGGRTQEIHIELRTADLLATNITALQVQRMLAYANMKLPSGTGVWKGRSADIRFDGSFAALDELASLVVGATADGTLIRLSDVADIGTGYPEQSYLVTSGDKQLLTVSVTKRLDGNTVSITGKVKQVLAQAEAEAASAVRFSILTDDSRSISASLLTVAGSGLTGVLMAVLVILLFLADYRATLVIALSIPLSILFTFIGMRIAGITINLMSLSGLVIALGMVVDGSIVMLEQTFRIHGATTGVTVERATMEQHAIASILEASRQVSSSILASTTTTIAVFIPISMLSGLIGSILRDVSLTLILAMLASLLVALTVVPFLLRLVLGKPSIAERLPGIRKSGPSLFNRGINAIERAYKRALAWSISHRLFILVTCVGVLVATTFVGAALGLTFIPSTDNSDFYVDLEFPQGQALEQTAARCAMAEQLIRNRLGAMIDTLVMYPGRNSGYGASSENQGYARVILVPRNQRSRSIQPIILEVQQLLAASIPDAKVSTVNGGFDKLVGFVSDGGGYGLTLVGEDLQALHAAAVAIRDQLAQDPEVVAADIDSSFDSHTLVLDMDVGRMHASGVSSAEAAMTVRILHAGVDAGTMSIADGKLRTIRLSSDIGKHGLSDDTLAMILVPTMSGGTIPLASIARYSEQRSVSTINHSDRSKTITISASLVSEDTSGVLRRMSRYFEEHPLPPGITSRSGGLVQLIGSAVVPMATALAIAVFLVYTVMVIQFERFRQPLIVMLSIPFCLAGVVVGLLVFGSSISLISIMAVIALGGIVVNNGIILIDSINLLRTDAGDSPAMQAAQRISILDEALERGGSSRLRPILMTTLTTMLGVVPMALAAGEGSEIYAPLGQAISGGLFSSTLITLFIIPIIYHFTETRVIHRDEASTLRGTGGPHA